MDFTPPLVSGHLIRRYKRFLADVTLDDGSEITACVPNTGSMLGLDHPGERVYLSTSDSPTRKYKHRLEIVEADNTLVGVNTSLPNILAEEAIINGLLPELDGFTTIKREQRYGQKSRIDLLLQGDTIADTYVEVKNVHAMRTSGLAEFPDTKTARGARHLEELAAIVQQGKRGVMLFVIQRDDCDKFAICEDLDPLYARNFQQALAVGVEAYAVACQISVEKIIAHRRVEIIN